MSDEKKICECFYEDKEKVLVEWAIATFIDNLQKSLGPQAISQHKELMDLVDKWNNLITKVTNTPLCEKKTEEIDGK